MLWIKTFHLLFVIAWMSALFYLPRILVHFVEGKAAGEDVRRLAIMGRKLYRFGHVMMGLAVLLGLWLWFGYGISGGWLHAKLALVFVLIVYFIATSKLLKRAESGAALPGSTALRVFNEVPVFVLLGILSLVILKPF
ncbi:MAG: CopD family protein [Steroidobacteraceae bacterium]